MVFERFMEAIDSVSADFLLCAPPSSSTCYGQSGIQPIRLHSVARRHALRHKAKVSGIVEQFEFQAGEPTFLSLTRSSIFAIAPTHESPVEPNGRKGCSSQASQLWPSCAGLRSPMTHGYGRAHQQFSSMVTVSC